MLLGKGAEMKCEMEAFACDSVRKQRAELYNYTCVCVLPQSCRPLKEKAMVKNAVQHLVLLCAPVFLRFLKEM